MYNICYIDSEKGSKMSIYPIINVFQTGQRIKYLMKQQNYSVRDIQEYLGFSTPQSIYHWFVGRNLSTLDNLYALSSLLHVPVDSMLCGNRKENWFFTNFSFCHRLLVYYEKLSHC